MDARQLADLEGTLVTAGLLGLVVGLILAVVAPNQWRALRASFAGLGLWVGAGVALLAMAGSLWFSESAGFPPCELCWYQRIAMYPLVLLLGIAAVRRDRGIRPYALALAGVGLAISLYHNVVETFPNADVGTCDPANPCTVRWVEGLGFWTIPRMAAACFVFIIAALLIDPGHPDESDTDTDTDLESELEPELESEPAPQEIS